MDKKGKTRMVDVSGKAITSRRAVAEGKVLLTPAVEKAIRKNEVAKGNVLEVARIAGIQAAKKTAELIPLCHPIPISGIEVNVELVAREVRIRAEIKVDAKTGAEMEALTAVSVAALVVYDMCKGIDKGLEIGSIQLVEKEGGKSGHYLRRDT
ncbi:cyclic pyranopterin monophosphate synthase MoaC [bacterium]|nr:cyclic pyranopterin monophosphate synthase MoaC [bacterium]MCI0604163.1 cyclic pyranopterin monophosphate synthase MoaC [bacterium]